MDERTNNNYAELCGTLAGSPAFSHESRGEQFFTFPLNTKRLSGTADVINIIARESLFHRLNLDGSRKIHVYGELRSFNNKLSQRNYFSSGFRIMQVFAAS